MSCVTLPLGLAFPGWCVAHFCVLEQRQARVAHSLLKPCKNGVCVCVHVFFFFRSGGALPSRTPLNTIILNISHC